MNIEHYRKLERIYMAAPLTEFYDTTQITISEGHTEVSIQIDSKYFHALGAIHGAVYFKLLDDSTYFAANSLVEDHFLLTTNFNINIIRPANKGIITAKADIRFASKNLWIAEGTIYNDQGKEIAFGTGHFARSKTLLMNIDVYR